MNPKASPALQAERIPSTPARHHPHLGFSVQSVSLDTTAQEAAGQYEDATMTLPHCSGPGLPYNADYNAKLDHPTLSTPKCASIASRRLVQVAVESHQAQSYREEQVVQLRNV